MAVRLETPGGSSQHGSSESQEKPLQPGSERTPLALSLEESLHRGTRLLATLTRAARAARLEAEVAELEAGLEEARSGDARRLQRWLIQFDGEGDTLAWAPTHVPAIAPLADGEQGNALGWESYLVHARRRLQELYHSGVTGQPAGGSPRFPGIDVATNTDAPTNQPAGGSPRFLGVDVAHADAPTDQPADGSPRSAGVEQTGRPRVPADGVDAIDSDVATDQPADASPRFLGIGVATHADAPTDQLAGDSPLFPGTEETGRPRVPADGVAQTPVLSRPMLSGFSLSLLGHLALLAVLFTITLKVSDQSASLGSQIVSVSAPMENVELVSELESIEPVELELADVMESSIDTSNLAASGEAAALSQVEPVDASTLLAAASGAAPGAASAGAALSAAVTSQGGGGSRGSLPGAPAMSSTGGKFFGAGAGGNFFCYVVDSSGSMRGAAWESAKGELVRSISTLSEKQRFYIVFFAREVVAIPEPGGREPASHGLAATKENIEHARRWIETVKLDRGGPPNDALDLAISREPDAIYLLTDGVTQVDVCGFLRKRNRVNDIISGEQVRVPIHAIAYRSLKGQNLLRQLARENAGQFHYVPAR